MKVTALTTSTRLIPPETSQAWVMSSSALLTLLLSMGQCTGMLSLLKSKAAGAQHESNWGAQTPLPPEMTPLSYTCTQPRLPDVSSSAHPYDGNKGFSLLYEERSNLLCLQIKPNRATHAEVWGLR